MDAKVDTLVANGVLVMMCTTQPVILVLRYANPKVVLFVHQTCFLEQDWIVVNQKIAKEQLVNNVNPILKYN